MTKTKREKLEKAIKRGKWSFVFWQGVVGIGFLGAVFASLLDLFIDNRPFLDAFPRRVAIMSFFGSLSGLWLWSWANREYNRLNSKGQKTNLSEPPSRDNTRQE